MSALNKNQGKPARIYIKKFVITDDSTYQQKSTSYSPEAQNFTKQKIRTCKLFKIGSTDISKQTLIITIIAMNLIIMSVTNQSQCYVIIKKQTKTMTMTLNTIIQIILTNTC